MIEVRELEPGGEAAWSAFLESSNNATLFHSLDFLAYHAPEKFCTRHLVLSNRPRPVLSRDQRERLRGQDGAETLALFPAAVLREPDGRAVLKSPYGASVGGLVLPAGQGAEQTREVVRALVEYARAAGLDGIEMRLAPAACQREPHDHLGFALFAEGFRLTRRHLCHMVALPVQPRKSKLQDGRMGLRRGLVPLEAEPEHLPDFYRLLLDLAARHGAPPTHTEAELAGLFQRLPGRLRLFLCRAEDAATAAGIVVFVLNPRVACTFYIASADAFRSLCPTAVLLLHVAEQMAREGFVWLDLGPSTFDDLRFNSGLAVFKEGFGALGHCRDTWRWDRG